MVDDRLKTADELRKNNQHDKAIAGLQQMWESSRDPDAGWRLANCLRHEQRAAEAMEIVRAVLEKQPDNEWARREAIWCAYDAELKPAVQHRNFPAADEIGRRILEWGAEGVARERVVLTCMKAAKEAARWTDLLRWSEELHPADLSPDKRRFKGRDLISPREQWYHGRLKALARVGEWDEARRLALQALSDFPGHRDFRRWAGLALANQGHREEALEELKQLASDDPAWYILDSVSTVARDLQRTNESLQYACRAALGPGQPKAKVNVIARIADLCLQIGNARGAFVNARLAIALREKEGWPVKEPLRELSRKAARQAGEWGTDGSLSELEASARATWNELAHAPEDFHSGQLTKLQDERGFGFINDDDGNEIFVLKKDLPPACQKIGARVRFVLERSFDKKKNRESYRATAVQPDGQDPFQRREPPPAVDDLNLDL